MNIIMCAALTVLLIISIIILYFIYCIFCDIDSINESLQQDRKTFIKICDDVEDTISVTKNIIKSNKELINEIDNYIDITAKNVRFIKQNMIRRKKPIID